MFAQNLPLTNTAQTAAFATLALTELRQGKSPVSVTATTDSAEAGFTRLCDGGTDLLLVLRPLNPSEMAACRKAPRKYLELPLSLDTLIVAVNKKHPASHISLAALAQLWRQDAQGRLNHWNQLGAGMPTRPLKLYGPGRQSEAYGYLSEAIVAGPLRGDYSESDDDALLAQAIARDMDGLSYLSITRFSEYQSSLKALVITRGDTPSEAELRAGNSPLQRPLLLYVDAKALERPEVLRTVEQLLASAPRQAERLKHSALPQEAYRRAQERLQQRRTGTAFAGRQTVGWSPADWMKAALTE